MDRQQEQPDREPDPADPLDRLLADARWGEPRPEVLRRLREQWRSLMGSHWRHQQQDGAAASQGTITGISVTIPSSQSSSAPRFADPISIIVGDVPSSRPTNVPLFIRYFSQVGPFSYLVSAALMCIAALGAWQYKLNDAGDADHSFAAASRGLHPAMIGCVTDMSTCRWAEDVSAEEIAGSRKAPPLALFSQVAAGRKFDLDSGLVEITFSSGAKVILQGPATFEVEPNGGFLSFGKLTGVFEKGAESSQQTSRVADSKGVSRLLSSVIGSNSDAGAPNVSPFFVRTPTATIVDLGTEFGIDVDRNGRTASYVFRGAVKVYSRLAADDVEDSIVKEGESVHVSPNGDEAPTISRANVDPKQFTRHVNRRRIPIKLFNTGIGVERKKPDPHWQVVAASNDPEYKTRQAVVAMPALYWAPNDPKVSQWIHPEPISRNKVIYTFRTTFTLPEGGAPETGAISGWFVADNHLRAIRLNGEEAVVPEHDWDRFERFCGFRIDRGFIEGKNVLEFDVENVDPLKTYDVSPMGLRVELSGSVQKK